MNDVVSTEGVTKLLKGLIPSETMVPDELHPRILEELAVKLGPVFAHLSLALVKSQKNGLWQTSVPCLRRLTEFW